MSIKYVFLPFKGTFEFALVSAAVASLSNGFLLENGSDFELLESGDFILQEA